MKNYKMIIFLSVFSTSAFADLIDLERQKILRDFALAEKGIQETKDIIQQA